MKSETHPASAFRKYLPGDYRKKTVVVKFSEPHAASVNSYWDGGSRSDYTLFPAAGGAVAVGRSPGFPKFENQTVDLKPGDVLVTTGTFCGKPATAYINFISEIKPENKTP